MVQEYRVADARQPLDEQAAAAAVDLAWARPHRNGVHVTYDTYSPENGLWAFVDAVYESLQPGGWALFDADDWLLPRLISYLQETWGDVAATYSGGGYRRAGGVVYTDTNGAGHYFTNGGYHVVFAHKGETDRESSVSARQTTTRPPRDVRRAVEWGTLKPISPYRAWLSSIMDSSELLYVPCAGTAPAALALEREWDAPNYICVDSERDAKTAFETRRELQQQYQSTL